MSTGNVFSTTKAEDLLGLARDNRIMEHYYPEYSEFLEVFAGSDADAYKEFLDVFAGSDASKYKSFLDTFSGGIVHDLYFTSQIKTFNHGLGHIPNGRIILFNDGVGTLRDSNWSPVSATLITPVGAPHVIAYYF